MPLTPKPTQISGALFLANRRTACLADEPRVGKTGAAIMAADMILAERILVITTASGRAVWRRAFPDWSVLHRPPSSIRIISWGEAAKPATHAELLKERWDLMILDESHYAKSFDAARTCAVYGAVHDGSHLADRSLYRNAEATWCLTGTLLPNSPFDAYPMMLALCPERLHDVQTEEAFLKRYTVNYQKKVGWHKSVRIIVKGKNEAELGARLKGFVLARTQKDVGITSPIFTVRPLELTDRERRSVERGVDMDAIMAAIDAGATGDLEMHLGPLRRLTGEIKAHAVVDALKEEFDCGLDKIVLMHWHTKTGAILAEGLAKYGVRQINGATTAVDREAAELSFRNDPAQRVLVGQIQAAGEAIDLSAAAELWFVESSFIPKDMKQASMRITNYTQIRQPLVRVCMLENSIDEAVETVLMRKWATIKEVMDNAV